MLTVQNKVVTKVYETERATLYHASAEDVLDMVKPDFADLLVTDPPYGQDFKSNRANNFTTIEGDDGIYNPVPALALALRKMRRFRHAYIFGPFDLTPLVDEGLIQEPGELIWDKNVMGTGDLQSPWGSSHENIQFSVAVRSKVNVNKGEGRLAVRLRRGTVLRHQRPHSIGAKRHPTEKPVGLLRELIESSSIPEEIVFDPYAGSGSTLIAALIEGRRAIGVEIDGQYIPGILERLSATETWLNAGMRL